MDTKLESELAELAPCAPNPYYLVLISKILAAPESHEREADELKEAAERAKESKQLAPVSLTMAILAVLVAT